MTEKNNSAQKNMDLLIDELGEELFQMTDEEYTDYKKSTEKIDADAFEVRNIFNTADKLFRKKSLHIARENYAKENAINNFYKDIVRKNFESARNLFETTLFKNPKLFSGLTFQNRDIKDYTEKDIETAVVQLLELGLIDKSSLDKTNIE